MFSKNFAILILAASTLTVFAQNNKGLSPVSKLEGDGDNAVNKFGYIDETGKLIIPYIYDDADDFSDGMANVVKNGKTGYIDITGKLVIPFKYESGKSFMYGYARIPDGEIGFYIDKNDKKVVIKNTSPYARTDEFKNGLIRISVNGRHGFVNTKNEIVIPADYDRDPKFADGIIIASKENIYYAFDTTGKKILETKEKLKYYDKGYIRFNRNEKEGMMDITGEIVLDPIYYSAFYAGENVFEVMDKEKDQYRYIDKSGKAVSKPVMKHKEAYVEDVRRNGNYYADIKSADGKLIKSYEYHEGVESLIPVFRNGLVKINCVFVDKSHDPKSPYEPANFQPIYVNMKGEIVWKGEPSYSCFPGNALITMADLSQKPISEIIEGDQILSYDELNKINTVTTVTKVQIHEGDFGITNLTAYSPYVLIACSSNNTFSQEWNMQATFNHPVLTETGIVPAGKLTEGDKIYVLDETSCSTLEATVIINKENTSKTAKVYNLKTKSKTYFVNSVVVMVK